MFQSWTITAGNTDKDGDSVLPFAINASTGAITVNDVGDLDREQTSSFTLSVTVSDGVHTSAAQTVTVNLTDVNGVTPVVTARQSFSVEENSAAATVVGTVQATDGDVTATTFQNWTITGGNTNVDGDMSLPFAINAASGKITVNDSGDLNGNVGTFNLLVMVSDGVQTSVTQTVAVNVVATLAAVSGGVLTITDTGTPNNQPIDVRLDGMGNLIVHDPNNVLGAGSGATQIDPHTISIPFASLTQLVVNAGGGNDTLTLNFANGNPIPSGGLTFNGGAGADALKLVNVGSMFVKATYNSTNKNDGNIQLDNGTSISTITYTGLEPISNDGLLTENLFNLPNTNDTDVRLLDIGGADGFMRLNGSTFETIVFSIGASTTSITINANGGDDRVTIQSTDVGYHGVVIVNGGTGNDALSASGSKVSTILRGEAGNDTLTGSVQSDTLSGGAGKDSLDGGAGTDTVAEMTVDSAMTLTNTQLTGNGTDKLLNIERAALSGTTGDNTLDASAFTLGNVTLLGGNGNDTLLGSAFTGAVDADGFNDSLDGGADSDMVRQSSRISQTLVAGPTLGTNVVTGAGSDLWASIEGLHFIGSGNVGTTLDASQFTGDATLAGGSGNDVLIGGSRNNVLNGNAGNDLLTGGNNADTLSGGDGNDILVGNGGNDLLNGQNGNDTLRGNAGDDRLLGEAGSDKLFGGSGQDLLDGGTGNDVLTGEVGNDTINGSAGSDAISGGDGDDMLNGGVGNDTILGGNGDDILRSGGGADYLSGGNGNDRFEASGSHIIFGGGDDTVVGSGNKIDAVFTFDFEKLLV